MALSEQSIIDQITVDSSNNINVRRADQVLRNGVVISQTYHRHVLTPGDDLTDQADGVKAIAAAVWSLDTMAARTAEVVAAAQAETAQRNAALAESEAARIASDACAEQARLAQATADAELAKQGYSEALLAAAAAIAGAQRNV